MAEESQSDALDTAVRSATWVRPRRPRLEYERRGEGLWSSVPRAAPAPSLRVLGCRMKSPPEACDFCGAPRAGGERLRLVWDSELGGDLVLADLCDRCASQADRLLEMHGGRGRTAVRLTQASPVSVSREAPVQGVGGTILRGLAYVLIAVATFVAFTFVTTRGWGLP